MYNKSLFTQTAMEVYNQAFTKMNSLTLAATLSSNNEEKIAYCEDITRVAYRFMEEAQVSLPRQLAQVTEEAIYSFKRTCVNHIHATLIAGTIKPQPKKVNLFA